MATERNQPSPPPVSGYETRDVNTKWLLGLVLFLLLSGLAIQVILVGYLNLLKHELLPTDRWRPRVPPSLAARVHPPLPPLQVAPPADLQAFRAREEAELHSYGWLNPTDGIVRIPIERAMDLVLQEGLPTRSGTNKAQAGPSSYQLIQQRPQHREPEIKGAK